MLKWIARFTLPVLCTLQLIMNLRLAPEASPRKAQQLVEESSNGQQSNSTQIKMYLSLNASAASSLFIYNVILSSLSVCFSVVLLRDEERRHKMSQARDGNLVRS
jgi:hypothetical protein